MLDYNISNTNDKTEINQSIENASIEKAKNFRAPVFLERLGAMASETWVADDALSLLTAPNFHDDPNFTIDKKIDLIFKENIPYDQRDNYLTAKSQNEWNYIKSRYQEKQDAASVIEYMGSAEKVGTMLFTGAFAPESLLTGGVAATASNIGKVNKVNEAMQLAKISKSMQPKYGLKQAFKGENLDDVFKSLGNSTGGYRSAALLHNQLYKSQGVFKSALKGAGAGALENVLLSSVMLANDPTLDTKEKLQQMSIDALFGGVLGGGIGAYASTGKLGKRSALIDDFKREYLFGDYVKKGNTSKVKEGFDNKLKYDEDDIVETNKLINEEQNNFIDSEKFIQNSKSSLQKADRLNLLSDFFGLVNTRFKSSYDYIKSSKNIQDNIALNEKNVNKNRKINSELSEKETGTVSQENVEVDTSKMNKKQLKQFKKEQKKIKQQERRAKRENEKLDDGVVATINANEIEIDPLIKNDEYLKANLEQKQSFYRDVFKSKIQNIKRSLDQQYDKLEAEYNARNTKMENDINLYNKLKKDMAETKKVNDELKEFTNKTEKEQDEILDNFVENISKAIDDEIDDLVENTKNSKVSKNAGNKYYIREKQKKYVMHKYEKDLKEINDNKKLNKDQKAVLIMQAEAEKNDNLNGLQPEEFGEYLSNQKRQPLPLGYNWVNKNFSKFAMNYLDRTVDMSDQFYSLSRKMFRTAGYSDKSKTFRTTEELTETIEQKFNFQFQTIYQEGLDDFVLHLSKSEGVNLKSDKITGAGHKARRMFDGFIFKVGSELNVGKKDTINNIRNVYGEAAANTVLDTINKIKPYTNDVLNRAKTSGLKNAQTVVDNKEFYIPTQWLKEKMAYYSNVTSEGKDGLYDLIKTGLAGVDDNAWMYKNVSETSNMTWFDVISRAVINKNMQRSNGRLSGVNDAESGIREIEELLKDETFYTKNNIDKKEADNLIQTVRRELGADTSKLGANKNFNKRLKMDYSAKLNFTDKTTGQPMELSVWDLLSNETENLYSIYNRRMASQISLAETTGIKSIGDFKELMKVMRKTIVDKNGENSNQVIEFDKNYSLDSDTSVMNHLISGKPIKEIGSIQREFMRLTTATQLISLPLSQSMEYLFASSIGGYKRAIKTDPILKKLSKDIINNKYSKETLEQLQREGIVNNYYTNNAARGATDEYTIVGDKENSGFIDMLSSFNDKIEGATFYLPQGMDKVSKGKAAMNSIFRIYDLGIALRSKKIEELRVSKADNELLNKLEMQEKEYLNSFGTEYKGTMDDKLFVNRSSLGQFGLDENDVFELIDYLTKKNGKFIKGDNGEPLLAGVDIEKMAVENGEGFAKLTKYIQKVLDSSIQANYKGQSIPAMENNNFNKLIFQYMSYPVQAFTNHTRRFADLKSEGEKERLAFYLFNTMSAGVALQMIRTGINSYGYTGEERNKYLDDNMSMSRLLLGGINQMSIMSLSTKLIDSGATLSTGQAVFNNPGVYNPISENPTTGYLKSLTDLATVGVQGTLNALGAENNISQGKVRSAMGAVWGLNLPFMKNYVSTTFYPDRKYYRNERLLDSYNPKKEEK